MTGSISSQPLTFLQRLEIELALAELAATESPRTPTLESAPVGHPPDRMSLYRHRRSVSAPDPDPDPDLITKVTGTATSSLNENQISSAHTFSASAITNSTQVDKLTLTIIPYKEFEEGSEATKNPSNRHCSKTEL